MWFSEKLMRAIGLLCLTIQFALPAQALWMKQYIVTKNHTPLYYTDTIAYLNEGDTLYGNMRRHTRSFAVVKINNEWVDFQNKNGYTELYVHKDSIRFVGIKNPGNSPYLDDLDFLVYPSFLVRTHHANSRWPLIAAFILMIVFWALGFIPNDDVILWGELIVYFL